MFIGRAPNERANFIANTNSGTYKGTTEADESCILTLQKGEGMIMKIQRKEKPEWFECIEYDNDGCQIGVFYEPYKE